LYRFFIAALAAMPVWSAADSDPVFPYGAVYFRKSNPPEQDWARDHRTAARIGMNTFRHWFMWGAIETAPGKYDWRDYDRMMDLAAQNGIKVVIAELITSAPEWSFRKYAHARFVASDGSIAESTIGGSSATGGFPGLCLDNAEVREAAGKFLTALVERYRNHPALLGYDLWNENTFNGGSANRMYCYCEATRRKLREWLRRRYGSLEQVGRVWNRYSYSDWEDIQPPRNFGGYPESLDWLDFRIDDAFELFHWRAEMFRRLDPKHLIAAHGVAGTLESLPSSAHDEWRSSAEVDTWGFTFVASRKGDEPWKQFQAVDLVRGGSRGKPFWHAEAEAGPLWMQPQVIGRPREDGRIPDEADVRLWNLVSCAGGATGILYPRWRPLLDGPLFGAFGAFGMDGSITPRAEMTGKVAKWANAHPEVWASRPVQGDIGLLFAPESEMFNYVQQGSTDFYAQSIRGAYQAFFDSNIQADFVSLDDMEVQNPVPALPCDAQERDGGTTSQVRRGRRDSRQRRPARVLRRSGARRSHPAGQRARSRLWRARALCGIHAGPAGQFDFRGPGPQRLWPIFSPGVRACGRPSGRPLPEPTRRRDRESVRQRTHTADRLFPGRRLLSPPFARR
jgi:beta-galactosidase